MKRIISVGIISVFALMFSSGIVLAQQKTVPPPPPPPPAKTTKTEKHIKMVKVDDNGKKVELDTVLTSDEPFVWEGDTIGGKSGSDIVTVRGFKMDSTHYYNYKVQKDGKNLIIFDEKGGKHFIPKPPVPGAPMPPHVMMFGAKKRNVIDLSDPGIISYNKKIQKDGTEKITIVRKQVPENEESEDLMIHSTTGGNAFFMNEGPGHTKTVKVIKSDDGTTKIIEDDEVIHVTGEDGEAKFIGDDGKVIIVKEVKKGDQKDVEVKVETKADKK